MLLNEEYSEDRKRVTCLFQSSNISQIVYIEEAQLLYVFFKKAVYSYEGVNRKMYSDFAKSESQGKFFNQNIKNNKDIYFRKEFNLREYEIEELKFKTELYENIKKEETNHDLEE